jgi:tetratricopeptide (TPR) repeat protein
MPDISLLPALSGVFGVSIDDLFDLTQEQRLLRIEHRMKLDSELPGDVFAEFEEYLRSRLAESNDKRRILSLLGHLYHHRMTADAKKVSRYARESLRLAPEKKDCQWLLDMAEGAYIWDWNVANHARIIDFYKELIENDHIEPHTPLPYYYLIDNLIADRRTDEARQYLDACQNLPAFRPFLREVYLAHIELAEFHEAAADSIMESAMERYRSDGGFLFEAAQYHARKCEYEQAIACYEASYSCDEQHKPRFTDALQGIAAICEITGDLARAVSTYDRILDNLKHEWGFSEETAVLEAEREKNRLLKKLSL